MGRYYGKSQKSKQVIEWLFPIIPPQVNGAIDSYSITVESDLTFPIIPPQVNGAIGEEIKVIRWESISGFPIIPPQVNGAILTPFAT